MNTQQTTEQQTGPCEAEQTTGAEKSALNPRQQCIQDLYETLGNAVNNVPVTPSDVVIACCMLASYACHDALMSTAGPVPKAILVHARELAGSGPRAVSRMFDAMVIALNEVNAKIDAATGDFDVHPRPPRSFEDLLEMLLSGPRK